MSSVNPFVLDSNNYPLRGFNFEVNFTFSSIFKTSIYTSAFQSVNGISQSTKVTKMPNGGDNFSEYHLPNHKSFKDITLKRGIIKSFGENYPEFIVDWFENLGWDKTSRRIWPCLVQVVLKDTNNNNEIVDTTKWTFYHAYPTSVVVSEFNSQKSEVTLETLTLAYSRYDRENLNIENG